MLIKSNLLCSYFSTFIQEWQNVLIISKELNPYCNCSILVESVPTSDENNRAFALKNIVLYISEVQ